MGETDPSLFEMRESRDADGILRVYLIGELDLAAVDHLESCLRRLKQPGVHVRLDLSRLEFIDSSGLRVLITAAVDARRDSWGLDIEPTVRPQVRRLIDLVGVSECLWPVTDVVVS